MEADSITQIIPHLFLGTAEAAYSKHILINCKITHILCCAAELSPSFPEEFKYLSIPINNEPESEMFSYLSQAKQFIDEGISKGNVLVHWYYNKA